MTHFYEIIKTELKNQNKCNRPFFRFELDDGRLKKIETRLIEEIHRGLNKDKNKTANIKSFVTYVTKLPTGEESGKYLALDLGGTNFRVIVVEITSGCRSIRMQSTKHAVSSKYFL